MATAEPDRNDGNNATGDADDDDANGQSTANFECNICLDTAKDAVISMCGHLFWYVYNDILYDSSTLLHLYLLAS